MKGLLSGLKSESIHCDASTTSAEDEASSSTRSPLRMPLSSPNVSTGSIHSGPSATATRSAPTNTDGNETAKLTYTIMTLKLEMAELRTSLDATSNRESKLRAANADLEDRCNRLTTERDKYKSKLRKAVDALSHNRTRIKDMERSNAELRVRLEATEAERDGAKRERRSALDKLLSSSTSFDDDYGSVFDEGDGASVATDGVASIASRSIRSILSSASLDNSQRRDYVTELKGAGGGNNHPLSSRPNKIRRGRKPSKSRDEPSIQQHQYPSDAQSDDEGYLRGDYSTSSLDQYASTSLCSLVEEKVGATATFDLNDTSPRSTRGRHFDRRSRSMGNDGADWEATRSTAGSGRRSWLRQSLDHVFQPSGDNSSSERTFRIPSILGSNDNDANHRASLASLAASMESEQVAIQDALDPKKGASEITAISAMSAQTISTSSSSMPLPPNGNVRSLSDSSGTTSTDGAGSNVVCSNHDDDSLSVEDLSWPSQEERQALKEMRSRSSSTKGEEDPVAADAVADNQNEDGSGEGNSIQPTRKSPENERRNSNSSHDTARDVDLFFDMFKDKDDDSLGSEDAHYHELPPSKSEVSKNGNIKSKCDSNSASSYYSLEGGKIPLKRMPRRNSCDAQAA